MTDEENILNRKISDEITGAYLSYGKNERK